MDQSPATVGAGEKAVENARGKSLPLEPAESIAASHLETLPIHSFVRVVAVVLCKAYPSAAQDLSDLLEHMRGMKGCADSSEKLGEVLEWIQDSSCANTCDRTPRTAERTRSPCVSDGDASSPKSPNQRCVSFSDPEPVANGEVQELISEQISEWVNVPEPRASAGAQISDQINEAVDKSAPNANTGSERLSSITKMGSLTTMSCILQFSTAIYYAKEGVDTLMSVDVMRLGPCDEEVSCCFATKDGDGKAGFRYQCVSGELVFSPGETMKQITIPILTTPIWCPTLEFGLNLSHAQGATLGKYLFECRVKVISAMCFPTDTFKAEILAGDWESIPDFKLLKEFFMFNFHSNPIVNSKSKRQLISDQITNMYFILRLYITKILIDKVLGKNCLPGDHLFLFYPCPEDQSDTEQKLPILFFLAILMIIPQAFVHWVDYSEVFFRIGGTSRKTIQANLVRKYLNYDEGIRCHLGQSDLIMGFTRDTTKLVHDGYMQIFPFVQSFGRLWMMVILQMVMGANDAIIPVFIIPVILVTFTIFRHKKTCAMCMAQDAAENEVLNYVTAVQSHFRLICDYAKRPDAVAECERRIAGFNWRMILADAVKLNNRYLCTWLSLILTGVWIVIGGPLVIADPARLGTFLTNLQIFNDVGQSWTIIFDVMLKMQEALPYLQRICRYMNLPIDVEKRMRLNRRRRTMGEEARREARESLKKSQKQGDVIKFAADLVPIKLINVAYSYVDLMRTGRSLSQVHKTSSSDSGSTGSTRLGETPKGCLYNCTVEIEQGTLCAFVGLPGEGKSTLMRVFGGQLIPDHGDLLIPPHLRVLHISPQPMFFKDTLFNNLTYGVSKNDTSDGSPDRVMRICKLLQVKQKMLSFLDPDDAELFEVRTDWADVASQTQRTLLHLARAFIANPEILLIHKPTTIFDDTLADNTFRLLRDFVEKKGLEMDPEMIDMRRPRTCIITTARPSGVATADKVFAVRPNGVRSIDPRRVSRASALYESCQDTDRDSSMSGSLQGSALRGSALCQSQETNSDFPDNESVQGLETEDENLFLQTDGGFSRFVGARVSGGLEWNRPYNVIK